MGWPAAVGAITGAVTAVNQGVSMQRPGGAYGPGATGDPNIDRRWQKQVDLDQKLWLRDRKAGRVDYDMMRYDRREDANLNYQRQKEFAKNALTWQYEQARKAGLDPSVVQGAPGYSVSASFSGDTKTPRSSAPPDRDWETHF